MTSVRIADTADAGSILEIYRPYVLETAYSFETLPPSVEEFAIRIKKYLEKYPWIVFETEGRIAGYVYASVHRDREAYQWTCECSVYLSDIFRGRGVGSELYRALFDILRIQGFRNVYAGITIPNEASEKLHRRSGFEKFAEYWNIGYKLGRWHSVGWWRLTINPHDPLPEPPTPFNKLSRHAYDPILRRAAQQITANLSSIRPD